LHEWRLARRADKDIEEIFGNRHESSGAAG
jgi:hypothetical protein